MARIGLLTIVLLVLLVSLPALGSPKVLRWPDLIPEHLASTPIRPPVIDHDGPPSLTQLSPWGDLSMEELLVHELDGRDVRLAGYLVPLHMDAQQRIDEFLLVPYFGACIHVPPPPPNQVVHVTTTVGLDPARMHMAWVIEGKFSVSTRRSPLADAGYTIEAREIRLFGR
ncbi:MAG: DUF3299 domain-containing protein [Gammaproteobacteria bacterium]|nr:DUF3299 domain-containing protein [Gammaproteobacteria bacterium]